MVEQTRLFGDYVVATDWKYDIPDRKDELQYAEQFRHDQFFTRDNVSLFGAQEGVRGRARRITFASSRKNNGRNEGHCSRRESAILYGNN